MATRDWDKALDEAIEAENYTSAHTIAVRLTRQFPEEPKYPLLAATSLFHLGRHREALRVIRKAVTTFPGHVILRLFQIPLEGSAAGPAQAERCCRETLEILPADAGTIKAQVLNYLATSLWEQGRKDEALTVWRDTLKEFPGFEAAAASLQEHVNQYGEPKSVDPVMDDLNHFSIIHVRRYFSEQGRTQFLTEQEATQVYKAIYQTWNEDLVPRKDETDRMTPAEKTTLFESVEVDYDREFDPSLEAETDIEPELKDDPTEMSEEFLKEIDSLFPYLPSGGGVLAMCAVPLLSLCGMKERRFRALLEGKEPTETEKDLLLWGVDVASALFTRLLDQPKGPVDVSEALDIATERLEEDEAREAIDLVMTMLTKGFELPGSKPPRTKGRRRKG